MSPTIVRKTLAIVASVSILWNAGPFNLIPQASAGGPTLIVSLDPASPQSQKVAPGANNFEFARFQFQANTEEDLKISEITFTNYGTLNSLTQLADFNLKNFATGQNLAGTMNVNNNKVKFSTPIIITKGTTLIASLTADVYTQAEAGKTAGFLIDLPGDVTVLGVGTNNAYSAMTNGDGDVTAPLMTVSANELTMTVSSSTPPSQNLPQGSSQIPFLKIDAKANNSPITIEAITFTKKGISTSNVVNNLTLTATLGTTETLIASGKSLNTSNKVTFTNSKIIIPASQLAVLTLKGDITSSSQAMDTFYFGIETAQDVVAMDSNANAIIPTGTFPVYGKTMTVVSQNIQSVTLILSSATPPAANVQRNQNLNFLSFDVNTACGGEAVALEKITFTETGSIEDKELTNLALYSYDTKIASAEMKDNKVAFSTLLKIAACQSTRLHLSGTITNDTPTGVTVKFQIANSSHVEVIGTTYLYPLQVHGNFPISGNTMTVSDAKSNVSIELKPEKSMIRAKWNIYQGPQNFDGYAIYLQPKISNAPVSIDNIVRMAKGSSACTNGQCSFETAQYIYNNVYYYFENNKEYQAKVWLYQYAGEGVNIFPFSESDKETTTYFTFTSNKGPDLLIEKLFFRTENDPNTESVIVASVCNRGDKESVGKIKTYFSYNNYSYIHESGISTLAAGSCTEAGAPVKTGLHITSSGKYNIYAKTDYSNLVSEINEQNNSRSETVFVDLSNEALPNLYVSKISFYKELDNGAETEYSENLISAEICNNGNAQLKIDNPNKEFYVKFSRYDAAKNYTYYTFILIKDDYNFVLNPGSCSELSAFTTTGKLGITQTGTYSIKVQVDTANNIQESNENDNSSTKDVYVDLGGSSLPNLYIKQIKFYKYLHHNYWGDLNNTLIATICNIGSKQFKVSPATQFYVKYSRTGTSISATDRIYDNSGFTLNTGQCSAPENSSFMLVSNLGVKETGNYSFDVFVDSTNLVAESNENDNLLSGRDTYVDLGPTAKPDLVPSNLRFIKGNSSQNVPDRIRVDICNESEKTLNNADFYTLFTVSGGSSQSSFWDGLTLQPHECNSAFAQTSSLNINQSGTYNIHVQVDYKKEVPESNENNNSTIRDIYVDLSPTNNQLPDLVISELYFDPNFNGSSNMVLAKVCNIGPGIANGKDLTTEYYGPYGSASVVSNIADFYSANGNCQFTGIAASHLKITQSGTYEITAKTDSKNNFAESNETNNSKTQTITMNLLPQTPVVNDLKVVNGILQWTAPTTVSRYEITYYTGQTSDPNANFGGCSYDQYQAANPNGSQYCAGTAVSITFQPGHLEKLSVSAGRTYTVNYKDQNGIYAGRSNLAYAPYSYPTPLPVTFPGPTDLHVVIDSGATMLQWTNPPQGIEFGAAVYTGEASADEFKKSRTVYSFWPITDTYKKDAFRFTPNSSTPITVGIKLRDKNGSISDWSNIYTWYPSGYQGKTPIPPAGFEDEVITAYDSYINPFPDTTLGTAEGDSAAELYRRGVIGGYAPNGEFRGWRKVNRAEMAKFLLLARYGQVDKTLKNDGRFPDLKEGEWYVPFVIQAAKLGIIQGYPDRFFRPAKTIVTAEFLKMLTLTFGLPENLPYNYSDVAIDSWYARYSGIAQKYNLFPDRIGNLYPSRELTRAEVAIALRNYLLYR